MTKSNVAILISGNGSTLQALIDAEAKNYNISIVVSNTRGAYGLTRARDADILTASIRTEEELIETLAPYDLDLIILAGYMKLLSEDFVDLYEGDIVNIHPSLLPDFPGLDTHQRVLSSGEEEHGCTVHYVTKELDCGPIIAQDKLLITNWDSAYMLKERVQALERVLYPKVIKSICESRCKRAS